MELGFEHVFERGGSGWTLLLLHGTGGDEHDLVPLGRHLAPDAAILSPRGKVMEGPMPRFFRRHGEGRLDIPDLLARTDELAAFVRAARDAYGLDPARVVAVGLSNGANIAVSLLLRHPGLLRAAALLRPMLPYRPEAPVALAGTDVLVAAGLADPLVPAEQSAELVRLLEESGATVVHHTARAGHGLTHEDLERTARWLSGVLVPVPAARR